MFESVNEKKKLHHSQNKGHHPKVIKDLTVDKNSPASGRDMGAPAKWLLGVLVLRPSHIYPIITQESLWILNLIVDFKDYLGGKHVIVELIDKTGSRRESGH